MARRTVPVPRPRLLTDDRLEQTHEAAIRILGEIGLEVRSPEALDAAVRSGLRVDSGRVYPDRAAVEEFVAGTRRDASEETVSPDSASDTILLGLSQYEVAVHDLETDEILPFTTDRLIEAAKLVDGMRDRGVLGKAPGCPMDISPDLQPVLQYKIGAQHCRDGRGPVEVRSPRAMPYVMDMADVLGRPYLEQPIYVVSPLTLGGDSFDCALAGRDRLKSVWVSDMVSVGATAPIRLSDAVAMALAEVIGVGIVAGEMLGLRVDWEIRLCPFDPRALAISFGGPEEVLLQWVREDVTAFYHGEPPEPPWRSLHSQAKLPDAQAAAERMGAMAASALFGARHFGGAGCLSLDEVFSAEQLAIDCEIRDHVERLVAGVDDEFDVGACLAEVAAGLDGGFLGTETTSRTYRSVYWLPRLFERRSLGGWQTEPGLDLRARAKEAVSEARQRHDYELEPELMRELDRIYDAARRELGG